MKRKFLNSTIAIILLFSLNIRANNLQIANVKLSVNSTEHFIKISFDINWENSWRISAAPYNHDAVWIFVKYRTEGGTWQHATLSTNTTDHLAPAGSTIEAVADGKGIFIYRSEEGTGTNTWENALLHWNYTLDGVAEDASNLEISVLGIEMVYIFQGEFFAGDNQASSSSFRQGSADSDPWYIGSEAAINVTDEAGSGTGSGTTNAEYYYTSSGAPGEDPTGSIFTIPADFPKGYQSFYCMKYELTQGQYTEFLNLLTRVQQSARVATTITTDLITNIYVMSNSPTELYRNTIVCPSVGNGTTNPIVFSTATPDVACNYLSWADGIAYSDWAGLRPLSELEFEKACRGPENAINFEYAWGSATIVNDAYTIINPGASDETIFSNYSTTAGNANYVTSNGTIGGPFRVGIFAANMNNTGRLSSGAGYYGVMELSGSLAEHLVTVGNSSGRSFIETNGDGQLSLTGNADMTSWPDNAALGTGFRGGYWSAANTYMRTSIRNFASYSMAGRDRNHGFRSARSL